MSLQKYKQLLVIAIMIGAAYLIIASNGLEVVASPQSGTTSPKWPPDKAQRLSTTNSLGAAGPTTKQAPNGTLMAVYSQRLSGGGLNPYYTVMSPVGNSWSVPAPVHNDPDNALFQVSFVFNSASVAHAVWRTEQTIFHARQNQWPTGSNIVVSRSRDLYDPAIAIDNDDAIHIVWSETDSNPANPKAIYHSFSSNQGANWSTPQALSTHTTESLTPRIAVTQNNQIHVAWEEVSLAFDGGVIIEKSEIRYRSGSKSGSNVNWSAVETLREDLQQALRPNIIAQGNTVHVTFTNRLNSDDEGSGDFQAVDQFAYYIRRDAPGGVWSSGEDITQGTPMRVNTNAPFYLLSDMAECNNRLVVIYHGALLTDNNEQLFSSAQRGDEGWRSADVATPANIRAINPTIACRNGRVHLVYERIVDSVGQIRQIYYLFEHSVIYLPSIRK